MSDVRNVIKKEAEKTVKCKFLKTEIQLMWNVKNRPIGANGTI